MVHLVTVSLVQFAWFRYSDQKASHSSPSSKSLVILVVGTILGCLTACVYSLAAAAGVVHVALIAAVALETAASPSLAMAGLALVEALSLASLFFPRNLIVVVIRLAADLGLVCAELAPVDFTRGFLSASLALMLAIDLINHVMNLNETVDKLNAEKHSLENNLKLARDEVRYLFFWRLSRFIESRSCKCIAMSCKDWRRLLNTFCAVARCAQRT